jgi:hypothetical protein
VVEYSTHKPKVLGSNPSTGNLKIVIKLKIWLCPGSTVVEHLTHDPKIKGLNPATDTGRGDKAI